MIPVPPSNVSKTSLIVVTLGAEEAAVRRRCCATPEAPSAGVLPVKQQTLNLSIVFGQEQTKVLCFS